MADDRKLARIFAALSNPNRLRIYREILKGQKAKYQVGHTCLLSDAVRSLKIGSPTVSHHVKELVDAGLITVERQGKVLVCQVNPATRELAQRALG